MVEIRFTLLPFGVHGIVLLRMLVAPFLVIPYLFGRAFCFVTHFSAQTHTHTHTHEHKSLEFSLQAAEERPKVESVFMQRQLRQGESERR